MPGNISFEILKTKTISFDSTFYENILLAIKNGHKNVENIVTNLLFKLLLFIHIHTYYIHNNNKTKNRKSKLLSAVLSEKDFCGSQANESFSSLQIKTSVHIWLKIFHNCRQCHK